MIVCMTEAHTHYVYNDNIYCGKNSDGTGLEENDKRNCRNLLKVVLRLVRPLDNNSRNVTADNWFPSI